MQHLDIDRTDAVELGQQRANRIDCRVVLLHVRQQEHGSPGRRLGDAQRVDLGEGKGQRLLAEHRDAGLDGCQRRCTVRARGEDDDAIERFARQHLLQTAVEVLGRHAELRTDSRAVAGRQVGEGDQVEEVPAALDQGQVDGLGDGSEPDDADTDARAVGHGIHRSRMARLALWSAAARSAGSPGWGITSCSTTSQPE